MKAKVISVITIIILAIVELMPIAYALDTQDISINTTSSTVKFDTYFKNDKGEKINRKVENLLTQDNIYLYIKVEEGYIKNGLIEIENPNFEIINTGITYDEIEKIEGNKITLNKIRNEEEIELEIPIKANTQEEIAIDYFQKDVKINFTAEQIKNDGRTIKITKETYINKGWIGDAKAIIEQGISKYVVEEDTITLQQNIKTSLENSSLPIEKEEIKVQIPKINEISPKEIYVNGEKTNQPQDGIIIIQSENQKINGKIKWEKGKKTEYVITYIYDAKQIENIAQGANITLNTDLNITAYNLENKEYKAKSQKQGTLIENVNKLIMLNETQASEIEKGYMYLNETQTTYEENYEIDIAKINAEGIQIEALESTYQDGTIAKSKYKSLEIKKEEFIKMLGEEGTVTILNEKDEVIGIITNQTSEENGNYILEYEASQIKIQLSKTKTIGKITLKSTKQIKENKTEEEIKKLSQIQTKIILKQGNIIDEKTRTYILKEPNTQIELSIGRKQLSTTENNKNIELKTVLKTNNITCKLFKNPEITITLPEEIEKVEFSEAAKLLFTDELTVVKATYTEETRQIKINMQGEQTKYIDTSIAEGITIALNLNIKLKELTSTGKGKISVTVENDEEQITKEIEVEYQAPIGMVTINKLKGYEEGEEITAVNQKEEIGTITLNGQAKEAEAEIIIINNNTNKCKNIQILGRTPFEGNKSILTNKELGSTFTAELKNQITAKEGLNETEYEVLYSTNGNASKDLSDENNKWEKYPQDISKIKSYLIILTAKEMQIGEKISFQYKVTIPEGLRTDEKTYGTFTVYYDNVIEFTTPANINTSENQTSTHLENSQSLEQKSTNKQQEILIPSTIQAPLVGLATANITNVTVKLESDVQNGEKVKEGSVITYKAEVKNTGTDTLKNVTLTIPVPLGTTLREYIEGDSYTKDKIEEKLDTEKLILIPKLEPNKTYTLEMQVKVNEKEENINEITCNAVVNIQGYKALTSNIITNEIETGYIGIDLFTKLNQGKTYKKGENVQYIAYIQNIKKNEEAKKVIITGKIPEELEYVEASYIDGIDKNENQVAHNTETNTVTWEIEKIPANATKGIILTCKIKENVENFSMNLSGKTSETIGEITSNTIIRYVENPKLEIKHYANTSEQYINVGDNIKYNIELKNIGTADAKNIQIEYEIPTEIENLKIKIGEETKEIKDRKITLTGYKLKPEETLKITIEGTVAKLSEEAKGTITLKTKATVTAEDIEKIETEEIIHKIKVIDQKKEEKTNISGIAWIDSSRDGIKNEEEPLLRNIKVTLITKEDAIKVKETKTNKFGEYILKDIEPGEYIIIFEYDTDKYEITKYNIENAQESQTSKAALTQEITIRSGEKLKGAITDIIKLETKSIENINLGIVEKANFDLKLEKTISKITIQNGNKLETYDYTQKPKELAKIEIASKDIQNTNIIIEYEITIKNEGNIEGYISEIIDNAPKDLNFKSELNPNWYKSTDGNIHTKELENQKIIPGEEKKIKLTLTKELTESNLGTTMNEAEIKESYNNYGIKDQKQNEKSTADLIISIKTGTIATYITITITAIAALVVGTYLIKKYVC